MIKDYTIDYEQYRNRQQVGCMKPSDPIRSTGSDCTMMTYYGNNNSLNSYDSNSNQLYYCSSMSNDGWTVWPVAKFDTEMDCVNKAKESWWIAIDTSTSWFIQSYGQYKNMFVDIKDDVDYVTWAIKDDDDKDMGSGPDAVYQDPATNNYPQELYLISHDKTKRLLLRRHLKEWSDYNHDWWTGDSEKLYTIQVLQLRGLDAGNHHDFDIANSSWVYDGIIDTRACDYSAGFICHGQNVGEPYSGFALASGYNDGWQDLLSNDITISQRNIIISPLKDPTLAWNEDDVQINPFITLQFTAKLYGKNWNLKIPWEQINLYNITLQTAFSFTPITTK